MQIPDCNLDDLSRKRAEQPRAAAAAAPPSAAAPALYPAEAVASESDDDTLSDANEISVDVHPHISARPTPRRARRLSGYESMGSSI